MPQIRKHVTIHGLPFHLIDTVGGAEGVKHLLYRSEYGGYIVSFTDRNAKICGIDDSDCGDMRGKNQYGHSSWLSYSAKAKNRERG